MLSQAVAFALAGVAALVAALGGVELPRKVDADAAAVAILLELRTDVDAAVSSHFYVAGMEDVVDKDGYAEALVFEELTTQPEVYSASGLRLRAALLIVGLQFHSDV